MTKEANVLLMDNFRLDSDKLKVFEVVPDYHQPLNDEQLTLLYEDDDSLGSLWLASGLIYKLAKFLRISGLMVNPKREPVFPTWWNEL